MSGSRAAVFDCNVYLQAMLSTRGAAHVCWQRARAGDLSLHVAPFVIAEIRRLPEHPKLRRYRTLTEERVERFIEELSTVARIWTDPQPSFEYPRDPDDARYIDLAIATSALLIVSNDRDLLDLMEPENTFGKALQLQHPAFRVLTPADLLRELSPLPPADAP